MLSWEGDGGPAGEREDVDERVGAQVWKVLTRERLE